MMDPAEVAGSVERRRQRLEGAALISGVAEVFP
jgi:hypothetical protein